jgi:hypothetical protein
MRQGSTGRPLILEAGARRVEEEQVDVEVEQFATDQHTPSASSASICRSHSMVR